MMTVTRGFVITITSGLVGGVLGALLGYALGALTPDYYRTVFRMPPSVDLDPAQIGIGLGLTQGIPAGLVVGLVIVLAVVWSRSRLTRQESEPGVPTDADKPRR